MGIVSKKKILDKSNVNKNNIVLAIPSSGIHSNGYSLVRSILKRNKVSDKTKKDLLKPTKIYSKEILKLVNKNLINASAHITGGGLVENLIRSVPEKLSVEIDLSKIQIKEIFKWIKKANISDNEMLKTFNCGVGFCLILPKKNVKKVVKFFHKDYLPYEIGKITSSPKKINLLRFLQW